MPKYKFRWDNFDDETVRQLAVVWGSDADITDLDARSWLSKNVKRPNEKLIHETLPSLLQTRWFREFEGLKQVVDNLRRVGLGSNRAVRSQQVMR